MNLPVPSSKTELAVYSILILVMILVFLRKRRELKRDMQTWERIGSFEDQIK